ncbi:MAG TPA: TonB family protein [Pyrinomonadaceae bacterium]|jgi:TonB family protein
MNKQLQRLFSLLFAVLFSVVFVSAQENRPLPKTISGGVLNSKATNLVKPAYPAAAKAVNAEGAVNVQVTIGENGDVISAMAVSGHPLLRDASVQAARESKFSPTLLSGTPVKVTGVVVYNFVAGDSKHKTQIYMLLGTMLRTLQTENSDAESDGMLSDWSKEMPADLTDERAKLSALPKDESEKRQAMRNLTGSLKTKLSGAEAWYFELGENLAAVMLQIREPKTKRERTPDETILRTHLLKIRDLATAPPPDSSPAVLDSIKPLAALADKSDITGKDSVKLMVEAFDKIFGALGK